MPPIGDGPVQVRAPSSAVDIGFGQGAHMWNRQVGRRRIFVQTEGGTVVGLELDRADKVETVKKKVQAVLRVPTDQSDLCFGGQVLKEDLSEVRNDCPLLLTRALYRSSSSPCLSPTIPVPPKRDASKPFELVGGMSYGLRLKRLLRDASKGLERGIEPCRLTGGLGGAYCFFNGNGAKIAIVKPTDEEPLAPNNPNGFIGRSLGQPGLKRGVRVGETAVREVAAFLLDHEGFSNVPHTALVKVSHSCFHMLGGNGNGSKGSSAQKVVVTKLGSFQEYRKHNFDASEHGTSRFPASEVHRIGILDVRLFNTDRHSGNMLVRRLSPEECSARDRGFAPLDEPVELIPIDHGLCLPETLEAVYFEWLHWPQAAMPFSEEELDYIARLDVAVEVEMVRKALPMIREACLRILTLSTIFLQRAAAAGLTLADIGSMMSREVWGTDEENSEFETACILAKLEMEAMGCLDVESEGMVEDDNYQLDQEQFQFDMDQEEEGDSSSGGVFSPFALSPGHTTNLSCKVTSLSLTPPLRLVSGNGGFIPPPLLRLEELGLLDEDARMRSPSSCYPQSAVGLGNSIFSRQQSSSRSARTNFDGRSHRDSPLPWQRRMRTLDIRFTSRRGLSPKEQLRALQGQGESLCAALSFGEISDYKWPRFLEYFTVFICDAIMARREANNSHAQRLGTSCRW